MTNANEQLEGFGLGLRREYFSDVFAVPEGRYPGVDWFEIISENFMRVGGMPMRNLLTIRERYPMAMHGVSLSIGSTAPLNKDYLKDLAALEKILQPAVVSDHLCWTGVHGRNLHDLLPLPLTQETLDHVASRIVQVQDFLGRSIAIENPSTYVAFEEDEMTEWAFLAALTKQAGCGLLLDVNNIHVSAVNHDFDAQEYLDAVPVDCIRQIHLAGHQNNGDHIVDTHDAPVVDPVWDLYGDTIRRFGPIPTMIERDADIPPIAVVAEELQRARQISADAQKQAAA